MSVLLNNRYRILQVLGSGGCGQTFLAEDTHMPSNRRCVVKQLKPATSDPAAYQIIKDRFQREAALLEMLGRSNDQIPTLYAYFTEAKEFYLVQDWIEGKSLLQKLREEGRLSESAVYHLLLSLLPVLQYIHSQGIIHRDIKPDNIMLREADGKPVLIDFGAVKEVVTTVVDAHGSPTSSIVIGSPGFMPLEQATGRPVFASDLYSLGLTAIHLLTGKLPQELTDPHSGEISWRQHAANVSPSLAVVLNKATEPLARDRYQTARAMLEALQPTATLPASNGPTQPVPRYAQDTWPIAPDFTPLPAQPYSPAGAARPGAAAPAWPNSITPGYAPQTYQTPQLRWIVVALIAVCLVGLSVFVLSKYASTTTDKAEGPSKSESTDKANAGPERDVTGSSKSSSTAQSSTETVSRSVLRAIETYHAPPYPASGGVNMETYDYRKTSGTPNPPTLTDTFIVDIWQRMNMDLNLQGITRNDVSEDDVQQALNVYLERGWEKIAGYRPWTHWNYVRSLSSQDRETLAKEVVQYMAANGVKDVN